MNDSKTKAGNNEDHTLVIYQKGGQFEKQENSDKESLRKMNVQYTQEVIKKKRKIALDEYDPGTKFKQLPDLEKALRIIFLRKMWTIFTLQLVITFGLMCLGYIKEIKVVLFNQNNIFLAMGLTLLGLMLILLCFQRFTKIVPFNYISFVLWTLVESFVLLLFFITLKDQAIDLMYLIIGFVMIIGASIGVTLYCCMIKKAFNFFLCFLMCFLMIAIVAAGFLVPILISPDNTKIMENLWPIIIDGVSVFCLSIYFVIDTMVILNKIRTKYKLEDFLIAGLNLYIDPINVCAYIVTCIEY